MILYIDEALELVDLKLINEEIQMRHDLIKQMVGTLYPDIVRGEIMKLNTHYDKIYRISKTNQEYMNEKYPIRK